MINIHNTGSLFSYSNIILDFFFTALKFNKIKIKLLTNCYTGKHKVIRKYQMVTWIRLIKKQNNIIYQIVWLTRTCFVYIFFINCNMFLFMKSDMTVYVNILFEKSVFRFQSN